VHLSLTYNSLSFIENKSLLFREQKVMEAFKCFQPRQKIMIFPHNEVNYETLNIRRYHMRCENKKSLWICEIINISRR